ncbi:HNH endonuclease, partial [uncultured Muribaculum sp.]|uniref:HNH endonuclease n=1 Tax=uncultured Muribaculum sp. TaxID=1918613 RepID=UPI0025A9F96B
FLGVVKQGNQYQLIDLNIYAKKTPRTHLSDDKWKLVLAQYKNVCAACGCPPGEGGFQQDHKVPRARGGTDAINNWQPLCDSCNNIKSTACRSCKEDCSKCSWAYPEFYRPVKIPGPILRLLHQYADEHSYLSRLNENHFVMVEYGAESSCESTLKLINRCHSWNDTVDAVNRTADAGIPVGLHLILGLPEENDDTIMSTIDAVSQLPVDTVKLHQLQVIKGTKLARDLEARLYTVPGYTVDEYIDLCSRIVARLNPSIAIERFTSQSPASLLISPQWGLKNYEFTHKLNSYLKTKGIRQGDLFNR